MSDDHELGLLLLNEGGDVVESHLDGDWALGSGILTCGESGGQDYPNERNSVKSDSAPPCERWLLLSHRQEAPPDSPDS